jgi:hypothetical protein
MAKKNQQQQKQQQQGAEGTVVSDEGAESSVQDADATADAPKDVQAVTVTCSSLNVRQTPEKLRDGSNVVREEPRGAVIAVTSCEGEWWRTADGCFVMAEFVE